MTDLLSPPVRLLPNPKVDRGRPYGPAERAILSLRAHAAADREIRSWPGYEPTPLLSLGGLAARVGLGEIRYKDESGRFGLGSFKALGGAYGVLRVLAEEVERRTGRARPDGRALREGLHADVVRSMTVTCASDGNHGRSVAWGARAFGCRAVVYLPGHVSPQREAAISGLGARTVRVAGTYDDAVLQCAADAGRYRRLVVSDTAYPGYDAVPRDVMQGYAVLVDESLRQMTAGGWPTHVFVQGGVGGLAAATCAYLWELQGKDRPLLVVVEPAAADCLYRSAEAGEPVRLEGDLKTVMGCLSCGEPSLLAWQILEPGADAFMTIPDQVAVAVMRLLAEGVAGDAPVVSGESGVAGLAGLLTAAQDTGARRALRLSRRSRALVIGTEGAVDPSRYRELVGRAPEEVVGAV